MNSKGNRVILLLVLGLAAFSSAMKELNQVRQMGSEVHQYLAQWSEKITPAEVPPVPVVTKIETCQSKQSLPSVELSWLNNVAQQNETADVAQAEVPPPVVKRVRTNKVEAVAVKRLRRIEVDPVQFEVRVLNDHVGEQDVPVAFEFPAPSSFKFKARKHGSIRINPRDRELLKTLNRSLNLRIAS